MSKANRESRRSVRRARARAPRLVRAPRLEPAEAVRRGRYHVERLPSEGSLTAVLVLGGGHAAAFADLLTALSDARIDVVSVQGMTDEHGGFCSFVYVRPFDVDRTLACLGAL